MKLLAFVACVLLQSQSVFATDLKPGQTFECTKDGGRKIVYTKLPKSNGHPVRCAYVENVDAGGIVAGQITEEFCDAGFGSYQSRRGCREVKFISKP